MKKLALLLLLNMAFLFSPPPGPDDPICGRYVHITSYAGFMLNTDTYGFIRPAIQPGMLFEPYAQRQSRPLFIFTGSAIGYTWYYITLPFKKYLDPLYKNFSRGSFPSQDVYKLGSFYVSFILLNILVLWLSLYVFERIYLLVQGKRDHAMYAIMALIAANPVTKGFIWAVHTQMFTLLTPLLCVYLLLRMNRQSRLIPYRGMMAAAFAGGLLLLVYGNFLLLLPALLIAFNRNYILYNPGYRWPSLLSRNMLLVLLFILPTIGWIGLLSWNDLSYYSYEFRSYRQFVWIKDMLVISPRAFFTALAKYTAAYAGTLSHVLFILAGSLVIWRMARVPFKMNYPTAAVLAITALFFVFFWLLGVYEKRLTFSLVPLLGCLLVMTAKEGLHKKNVLLLLTVLVSGWYLFVLLNRGPFC